MFSHVKDDVSIILLAYVVNTIEYTVGTWKLFAEVSPEQVKEALHSRGPSFPVPPLHHLPFPALYITGSQNTILRPAVSATPGNWKLQILEIRLYPLN